MRNIVETPSNFKIIYDLSKKYYSLLNDYDIEKIKLDPNKIIKENFIFEDDFYIFGFGYRNHARLKSLSGEEFLMSNGDFHKLLKCRKYLNLNQDDIIFSGKYTFKVNSWSLFVKPVDLK